MQMVTQQVPVVQAPVAATHLSTLCTSGAAAGQQGAHDPAGGRHTKPIAGAGQAAAAAAAETPVEIGGSVGAKARAAAANIININMGLRAT